MKAFLTGNYSVSHGVKLARAQVVGAYPITPQTTMVERLADLCASRELEAEYVTVESEHSAMAYCMGAAATGARVFTATSSQGLAYMHEMLYWVAGARLPIVMAVANRALGAPWSLATDQTDSLAQRDSGWIQFYCESNQEVVDTVIQAYKLAETVNIPVMLALDGFYLSHTYEPVELPDQEMVDRYLPAPALTSAIRLDAPWGINAPMVPEQVSQYMYSRGQAMAQVKALAEEIDRQFATLFKRGYGIVEPYRLEDAVVALVTTSTITQTARVVVDQLREEGQKVGLLKIRLARPFPKEEIREHLQGIEKVAVLDRNISLGQEGIFTTEVKAALCGTVMGRVYGYTFAGGVDVTPALIAKAISHCRDQDEPDSQPVWGVTLL
ncbi:MAG: pyruvate ferredoxin oxidoreductase [Bacillota bacterium]